MRRETKPEVRSYALSGTLLIGGLALVGAGTFAILTLADLKGRQPTKGDVTSGAANPRGPLVAIRHHTPRAAALPPSAGAAAGQPVQLAPERPPWEATPENTAPAPEGQVPAWVVRPPAPDPTAPPPPPPVEPPDPRTTIPPMHNPGGVDGDRPERSPGLD